MEFTFHPTAYDGPGLEAETAELLRQRLEAKSRAVVPGMWKVTDKLNAHAARGPGREARRKRHLIYGAVLLLPGILVLILGLMEPRTPVMIWLGSFMILSGILEFFLVKEKKPLGPPAFCRREAAELVRQRRETDWEALRAEIRFDETGMTVTVQGGSTAFAYETLCNVFESERLWLVVYDGDLAHLLQKKDLISGEAGAFLPYLQGKIINSNLPYKGEST